MKELFIKGYTEVCSQVPEFTVHWCVNWSSPSLQNFLKGGRVVTNLTK
jgi:hypothetical protein